MRLQNYCFLAVFASSRLGARFKLYCTVPLVIVLVLSGGCGFKLRGSVELPAALQTTYIAGEQIPGDLLDELRQALKAAGARLVSAPQTGASILKILGVRDDRRVLSVNSVTGKVQEYELNYTIRFALSDHAGNERVAPQSVNLVRDFRFSETQVLGKGEEEALLKREMRREAVILLLRRLQAQGS